MDPLLRLTVALSRLSRRRWTKGQAVFALIVLCAALAIGLIEWLGYWPEALTAERARRGPMRW